MRQRFGQLLLFVVLLALITFGFQSLTANEQTDGSLKLWILNIGQGDAILIDTPTHQQILVDGGPNNKVLSELGKAMPPQDKEIDLVISTHNDADHLAGLNSVLEHYQVNKVWLTGAVHTTQTYQKFIKLLKDKNIPTELVMAGAKTQFGALQGIVISPLQNYQGLTPSAQNAAGIVTFWQYGNETFLLTADIEAAQEQALVARGLLKPVAILKVAHHGSKTSSTEEFLRATIPKIAVISDAKNNTYGHPHQIILDRLSGMNIPVLRTDLDGAIEFSLWPDHFSYVKHP